MRAMLHCVAVMEFFIWNFTRFSYQIRRMIFTNRHANVT